MCGIFGISRGDAKPESDSAYLALLFSLGVRSEERGRHSSGLAVFTDAGFSSAQVAKDTVPFRRLNIAKTGISVHSSTLVLGHTRFATQGSASDVKNASPLQLDGIVGTHNGDIAKSSVPNCKTHQKAAVSLTDTEILYRELQNHVPGSASFLAALEAAKGRIALAFVSKKLPTALVLVRGALSPIAYAYTTAGDLVYGSNPDWFRQIEAESNGVIQFRNITLVPEGTVLIFDTSTNKIVSSADFTPTCRESDLHLVNSSVYKNFTNGDKAAFKALSYHVTVTDELAKKPSLKVVPGYQEVAPARLTMEDGVLFDELFLAGLTSEPFTSEPDEDCERVTLEHVNVLCDLGKEFDEDSYEYLISSDDEDELEFRYAEVFIEMFRSGQLDEEKRSSLGLPLPLDATIFTSV